MASWWGWASAGWCGLKLENDMPTMEEYIKVIQAFKFYSVESEGQLVLALLEHVERLQAKLPPIKNTEHRTPREG